MNLKIKARAIILKDNKVLLIKDNRCDKYMLPWWTLENWETIINTLNREIKEELGITPVIDKCLYTREYTTWDNSKWIEFCFLISNIDDFQSIDKSKCTHWYEWDSVNFYDLNSLESFDVYPKNLKDLIINWLENTKIYLI